MNNHKSIGEIQSAERVKELTMKKIHANASNVAEYRRSIPRRIVPRFTAVAAVLIAVLSLATVALAYTGVLGNIFATFTGGTVNGGLGNDSRKAIVDNGFTEAVTNPASSDVLTLGAYYADEREIGFDFTLTSADVEEGFSRIFIPNCALEITSADGNTSTWVWDAGGLSDIGVDAAAMKAENGYDVSVIVSFHNAKVPVGKAAKLTVGGLNFQYAVPSPDFSAPDRIVAIDGRWVFDIDIADKFADVTELTYTAASVGADGITIESVIVLPTVCRIEATIDYSKNTLANPDNVNKASEPQYLPKLNVMDTSIFVTDATGKTYRFQSSGYYPDEPLGGTTKCYFEIDSMFFDAPEMLMMTFTGYSGTTIDVPLTISK